jgi:hypothetical protein
VLRGGGGASSIAESKMQSAACARIRGCKALWRATLNEEHTRAKALCKGRAFQRHAGSKRAASRAGEERYAKAPRESLPIRR